MPALLLSHTKGTKIAKGTKTNRAYSARRADQGPYIPCRSRIAPTTFFTSSRYARGGYFAAYSCV